MDPKLKRRVDHVDKLYKKALAIASPAEKKLLMKAHSNLDQMLSAGRDLNNNLLSKLGEDQSRVFAKLDTILENSETEGE